jgi:hypothetical protein
METKPIVQSRTVWMGVLLGVIPVLLQYLAGIDWTQVVPPEYAGMVAGAIMIAMRFATTMPLGRAK